MRCSAASGSAIRLARDDRRRSAASSGGNPPLARSSPRVTMSCTARRTSCRTACCGTSRPPSPRWPCRRRWAPRPHAGSAPFGHSARSCGEPLRRSRFVRVHRRAVDVGDDALHSCVGRHEPRMIGQSQLHNEKAAHARAQHDDRLQYAAAAGGQPARVLHHVFGVFILAFVLVRYIVERIARKAFRSSRRSSPSSRGRNSLPLA